ncbi:alpha/beta hydrolase [Paenibacillus sp. NEAU-GSW1]|uniref:alpha/beta hydrolase n=1 Tax=Paenibacillus sp. NEAU-GSW1 TaxID=2682486 RepID=UPI0015654B1A|nr:alpha/beta hydrolase [Paenibacillus sp. NEAU-GSW1]
MKRSEWHLNGMEGSRLYVREWVADSDVSSGAPAIRAVVCLLHGMGEHGERYAHVAERLTAAGYAVLAMDQEGHGKTEGKRGHMSSIEATAANVGILLAAAAERHAGIPRFLYGHSMGGNVALNAALRLKPDVQGVIAASPWLKLALSPSAIQLWLGKMLVRLSPGLSQSTGLKESQLYRPGSAGVSPIEGDRLSHKRITLRTFLNIDAAGDWAIRHIEQLEAPLLLLHGNADLVTSYDASAQIAAVLGDRCQFVSVEGGYHELHNDLESERVIAIIIDWMNQQL